MRSVTRICTLNLVTSVHDLVTLERRAAAYFFELGHYAEPPSHEFDIFKNIFLRKIANNLGLNGSNIVPNILAVLLNKVTRFGILNVDFCMLSGHSNNPLYL